MKIKSAAGLTCHVMNLKKTFKLNEKEGRRSGDPRFNARDLERLAGRH